MKQTQNENRLEQKESIPPGIERASVYSVKIPLLNLGAILVLCAIGALVGGFDNPAGHIVMFLVAILFWLFSCIPPGRFLSGHLYPGPSGAILQQLQRRAPGDPRDFGKRFCPHAHPSGLGEAVNDLPRP